jgi:hypothetical protein
VARPCESFGTRMLRRDHAGPLSEVTAFFGRTEQRWVLAGGRQVPTESVAQRSWHCARLGGEWVLSSTPMCCTDCGQWSPAKPCVKPGCPNSVSAPLGVLWAVMSGTVVSSHSPGHGSPRRPCNDSLQSPQRWRASGAGELWERTWGLGSTSCQPPVPGRLDVPNQPTVGAD